MWHYQGTSCSSEDMGRKFNTSWVHLEKLGVVRIHNFDDSGFYIYIEGEDTKYYPLDQFRLISEYPEVGQMVNVRGTAHYITRTPRRQWIAGLTLETLGSECTPTGKHIGRLTKETVQALFNPEYPDLETAYGAVSKKTGISMAFTPVYWIVNVDAKSIQLWRRGVEVGTIMKTDDTYQINIHDFSLSLTQELKDDLKNVKFTITN